MARILVVEDDPETADIIATTLRDQGHEVTWLDDGRAALDRLEAERFDVVTLDRMLPGLDGLGLAARLRARRNQTPVLMVSALGDVDERVAGLRAGGDDYLAKPFAVSELAMRVEVLLRRNRDYPEDGFLRAGQVEIDLVHRKVWVSGEPVQLLQTEFRLLEFLARHAGRTVARQLIFEQVWGRFFEASDNLINVHIAKLRKKLERPGQTSPIQTIKGEGYRLEVE
ncbi:MAG: response regulator transcription factor [Sphingomonadales bacterium]|nr:response regulator transcription factor [Sphingomonadales bacterium]MDE2170110.1 response regulator transcription factor [Sphingomonadales bacterium]